ncbi:hypothetical protein SVI_0825 [Shewanella violacea DSS12]|uniref:Uncharacterized protein n=1 Tax=Shewanella violacea (strain JCM 10179 / CIP 106290 / LMG 19151 / DSS12) TaxID=637905 RepID=D4ZGJ7_SHEVD|nr:hypothetical protein SVI_0825 [Shewanella violacea DSS12]
MSSHSGEKKISRIKKLQLGLTKGPPEQACFFEVNSIGFGVLQ